MLRFVVIMMLQALAFSTYAHACTGGKLSGFYAGLTAGLGKGDIDVGSGVQDYGEYSVSYRPFTIETQGALFGGYVGLNRQCGRLLFGIEGDIMWSGMDGDTSGSVARAESDDVDLDSLSPTINYGTEVTIKHLSSIRGRIGLTIRDVHMLYGTIGIGFTKLESMSHYDGLQVSATHTDNGLVLGGGYEGLVTDQMSLRAEVLHYRFGNDDTEFNPTVFRIGGAFHFR